MPSICSSKSTLRPFPPWEADLLRLHQLVSFPPEVMELNYPAPFLWMLSLTSCVPWLKIAILKVVLSMCVIAPSRFGKCAFTLFLRLRCTVTSLRVLNRAQLIADLKQQMHLERREATPGKDTTPNERQGLILSCGHYLLCHIDVFSHFPPKLLDMKKNGIRLKTPIICDHTIKTS